MRSGARSARLWMSTSGGEALYEADLPACCQRAARTAGDPFECVSCGAAWQEAPAAEPEECAFTGRSAGPSEDERRGAA